jgi:hypothetical protein
MRAIIFTDSVEVLRIPTTILPVHESSNAGKHYNMAQVIQEVFSSVPVSDVWTLNINK